MTPFETVSYSPMGETLVSEIHGMFHSDLKISLRMHIHNASTCCAVGNTRKHFEYNRFDYAYDKHKHFSTYDGTRLLKEQQQ